MLPYDIGPHSPTPRHRGAFFAARGAVLRRGGFVASLSACLALMGCLSLPNTQTTSPKQPRRPAAQIYTPSVASQGLQKFYADLERDLLTRGLLRTDGGGPDTPYDAEDLAAHFEALAFYDEYASGTTPGAGGLSRWEKPVRMVPVFAPSVSAAQRVKDREMLTQYAARLARITGHKISVERSGNFTVLFAGIDDTDFVETTVRPLLPSLSDKDMALVASPPRKFYCLVFAGGPQSDPLSYSRGVALIRAEQPPLMRESCIHEEVAQGLGLRNDSRKARPSIFNDDDEFARLTSHDEKLLQILYDPRLRVGMSAAEARSQVLEIAQEIMGTTGQSGHGGISAEAAEFIPQHEAQQASGRAPRDKRPL